MTTRLRRAVHQVREALDTITTEALERPLPMTCLPPAPVEPFPYGDVVPLGFLLMALRPSGTEHTKVTELLRDRRQGLLWAYHRDTLVTCTDSALVLQGFQDADGVVALERFVDDAGRYAPQLYSDTPRPGVMQLTPYNRHWCQPDYATTALVDALRLEAGLERRVETRYFLRANYEQRSGLYFANPYLVDWVLARALRGSDATLTLQRRLAGEILASRNADGTFGTYDVTTSTALAILALSALSLPRDHLLHAQERLADMLEHDGRSEASTPFYSSAIIPHQRFPPGVLARMLLGARTGQFVGVAGDIHAVSLYADQHRMISTSLAALALSADRSDQCDSLEGLPEQQVHPRYRCASPLDYITAYALPPYAR